MASIVNNLNFKLILMNFGIMILMLLIIGISYPFLPKKLKYFNKNNNEKYYLFFFPAVVAAETIIVFLLYLFPVILETLGFCFSQRKKKSFDEEAQMYKDQRIDMNDIKDGAISVAKGAISVTKDFSYTIVTYINIVISFVNVVLLLVVGFVVLQIDIF